MIVNLNIRHLIGPSCISFQDGRKVHALLLPELQAGNDIQLDFVGVQIVTAAFFNAAIGRLLKDIRPEALNKLLHITNLNDVGITVLRRVIENSKEYYSNPALREVLDEILSEQAEG
jgi:hypothetical protein